MSQYRPISVGDQVELTPTNGDPDYVAQVNAINDVGIVLAITEGIAFFPWSAVGRVLRK